MKLRLTLLAVAILLAFGIREIMIHPQRSEKSPVAPVTEKPPQAAIPLDPPVEPAVAPPPAPVPPAPPAPDRTSTRRDFSNPLVPSEIPGVTPAPPTNTDADTEIEFDKISLMFRDYRTLTGENPVGTNSEIMKSIMGGNPKGSMLGPPEGIRVNERGELIDRWGSPYFFHQLTRDLMEVRSAGPDGKLWTDDDLLGK